MATKKSATSSSKKEKTVMEKIGEQATHLKEELIAGKDHLIEAAGEKIDALKHSISEFRNGKKKAVKKAIKKAAKPAAKKAVKRAVSKKTAPKKAAKKTATRKKK